MEKNLHLPESEIRRLDREEAVEEESNKTRTEMIINMYNKKIDMDTIAEISNLFIEEVNNIIKNNKGTN